MTGDRPIIFQAGGPQDSKATKDLRNVTAEHAECVLYSQQAVVGVISGQIAFL